MKSGNQISFEKLKEMLLYRKIVEWNQNTIQLDNGVVIAIEETERDCCATAEGAFSDVKLDAAITDVSEIIREPVEIPESYGCRAVVTFMHNQNIICKAEALADAGNCGYYYSIASFVVRTQDGELVCKFVGSEDCEFLTAVAPKEANAQQTQTEAADRDKTVVPVTETASTLTAKPKKRRGIGKWIRCVDTYRGIMVDYTCSNCGFINYDNDISQYHYCPNCGKKMGKVRDDDD